MVWAHIYIKSIAVVYTIRRIKWEIGLPEFLTAKIVATVMENFFEINATTAENKATIIVIVVRNTFIAGLNLTSVNFFYFKGNSIVVSDGHDRIRGVAFLTLFCLFPFVILIIRSLIHFWRNCFFYSDSHRESILGKVMKWQVRIKTSINSSLLTSWMEW